MKVLHQVFALFLTDYIWKVKSFLHEEEFFEYYVNGTSEELSFTSEKALKLVALSCEDLQRLYQKEHELHILISNYKKRINYLVNEIRLNSKIIFGDNNFSKDIEEVTVGYFRSSKEFEETAGLGLVRLDDIHQFNKLQIANGTVSRK